MKAFLALLTVLTLPTAEAAPFHTVTCSTSDGSVFWERGASSQNTIHLKKRDGTFLALEMKHVRIELTEKHILDIDELNTCGLFEKIEIYTGKVKITPSVETPRDLYWVSENNEVKTQVICTEQIRGATSC